LDGDASVVVLFAELGDTRDRSERAAEKTADVFILKEKRKGRRSCNQRAKSAIGEMYRRVDWTASRRKDWCRSTTFKPASSSITVASGSKCYKKAYVAERPL